MQDRLNLVQGVLQQSVVKGAEDQNPGEKRSARHPHVDGVLDLTPSLVRAEEKPELAHHAGIPLAMACVIRPTNGLSLIVLLGFVFLRHRSEFLRCLLLAGVIGLLFAVINLLSLGTPLPAYYRLSRVGGSSHFFEALAGNLVSPSRGLFIFSPVLLFSLFGAWLGIRSKEHRLLTIAIVAITRLSTRN